MTCIDLYTALKLTDSRENEPVRLIVNGDEFSAEYITPENIRKKYDMRNTKVVKIEPKIYSDGEFSCMSFTIRISGRKAQRHKLGLTPAQINVLKERDAAQNPVQSEDGMICRICGRKVFPWQKFCEECGQRLYEFEREDKKYVYEC